MDNTRFLVRRSRLAARSLQVLSLSLAASPLWLAATTSALAQAPRAKAGAPVAAAPAPSAETVPRLNSVNVLILAFDDLSAPAPQPGAASAEASGGARAAASSAANQAEGLPDLPVPVEGVGTLPMPVAPAAAPVAPAQPQEPRDEPTIRPVPLSGVIEYRALAQQKDKAQNAKPRKKRGLTDEDFRTEPLPLPSVHPRKSVPNEDNVVASPPMPGAASGAETLGGAAGATGADGGAVTPPHSPFVLDSSAGGTGAAALLGPGRAQAVAGPLRRALIRAGFGDVLTVAPGSVALTRAIEANSLSPRSLEAARAGLAELALAPAVPVESAPAATEAASTSTPPVESGLSQGGRWAGLYQAAARVGQALGYRSVIVLGVAPRTAQDGSTAGGATFALAVVDALREAGEPIVFDEDAGTVAQANESAALAASSIVARSLSALPTVSNGDKAALSASYMTRARAAYQANDYGGARDYLAQVLAFEPNRSEARLMMADVLSQFDADAAARAYTTALKLDGVDGPTWARAAIAFTVGSSPSWPRALEAARKALSLGYESAELRQAMATAQMGRAALFRAAYRNDKADEADAEAQAHLDRALVLAPDDPEPSRLMAAHLAQQGRTRDALRLLDRIAGQYPDDAEMQTLYATTLFNMGGRDEDAFVAWAKVWRLSGEAAVSLEGGRYRRLSHGFDQRLVTLGKRAAQLSSSVAAGTADRGTALLQMTRYKDDMDAAIGAIRVMQPTTSTGAANTHNTRVFAANLMSQAMTFYTNYLETGQERMRQQATALQSQSILMLNAARGA